MSTEVALITLPMWAVMTAGLSGWQSTQDARITTGLGDVSNAVAQALAVGGTTRYATETALLAAAPGASGSTAWAQDTAQWWRSTGSAWELIGGGALSENALSLRVARYRFSRTPAENAAYINSLLAAGNVTVRLGGRGRVWEIDRSLIQTENSIIDGDSCTVRFSQVPVNQATAANPNAVITNKASGYVINSGNATLSGIVLRNITLDAGGFGQAGTSARYNGYSFTGVEGFLIENVRCVNGSGYLQWLPGCSYGTVRNTYSENGEENFELAEFAHHIVLQGIRCKNALVNNFLFYQGVHDVYLINCRAEGAGNGFNIAEAYGDCWNITLDATCSSDLTGAGTCVAPAGTTAQPATPAGGSVDAQGRVLNAQGAVIWVRDQNIVLNGDHRSRQGNSIQTLGGTPPKNARVVGGRWRGFGYGMTLNNTLPISNAEVIADVDPASPTAPAVINNTAPLRLTNVTLEMRGETNAARRKLGTASTGGVLEGVRGRGDTAFMEVHTGAELTNCRDMNLIMYYDDNTIRGGSFGTVSSSGARCHFSDLRVATSFSATGANNSVQRVRVAAGGTFATTHATTVEYPDNVLGTAVRAAKNVSATTTALPFVRVGHFGAQAITAAWVPLDLAVLSGSGWDESTDTFVAPEAGLYEVTSTITWAFPGAASGFVGVRAFDGGATPYPLSLTDVSVTAAGGSRVTHGQNTVQLAAGGTIRIQITGNVTGTVQGGTGNSTVMIRKLP